MAGHFTSLKKTFKVEHEKNFCTTEGRLTYLIKSDPLILFNKANNVTSRKHQIIQGRRTTSGRLFSSEKDMLKEIAVICRHAKVLFI